MVLASFLIWLCLDNSAFKEVYGPSPDIFRVYSAFATFTYSQLQVIFPDSFLGEVSDWDHFLSIDLTSPDLPLRTAADFLRNRDFANLVAESDIPTPTHFVEQALCFCRNICALLLNHKVCKSKLVRGFSIFDEAIVRHGEEEDYSRECEMLCDFFVETKWVSANTKPLIYSEYRSFVAQFRSNSVEYDGEWLDFLSGYYEMHCRENLFFVYKLCCLCLANRSSLPLRFAVNLPRLASDVDGFKSSVRSIQSSLSGIPNVSGLFSNPRTISPIFSILGKGKALLDDATFSVWDVTASCSSRRRLLYNKLESRYTCTISDEETLWTSVVLSPKTPAPSPVFSSGKFVQPSPFPGKGRGAGSGSKPKGSSPKLSTPTLSVPRVVTDVPFLSDSSSSGAKKLVIKGKKAKKDSGDK